MSEELKPCPFCGHLPDPTWKDEISIYCEECGVRALGTAKETAQEQWNNRPLEDKLRAENERLRALLKEWVGAGDCIYYAGTDLLGQTADAIDDSAAKEMVTKCLERYK